MPSSKWWASTIVTVLTAVVAVIAALQGEGIDLPEIVVLVGAVLSPIVVYLKPENRPAPSALVAIRAQIEANET